MGLKFSWVLKHFISELIKDTLTLDLLMPHYLLTAKPAKMLNISMHRFVLTVVLASLNMTVRPNMHFCLSDILFTLMLPPHHIAKLDRGRLDKPAAKFTNRMFMVLYFE